jgi:hypothetical protein
MTCFGLVEMMTFFYHHDGFWSGRDDDGFAQ